MHDQRARPRRDHRVPLRAKPEQLTGLPPALVVNALEAVLHDDGAGYAGLLREAGVPVTHVTCSGTIHDVVMVDALHDRYAAKAAVAQAVAFLAEALGGQGSCAPDGGTSGAHEPRRPGRPAGPPGTPGTALGCGTGVPVP